MKKKQSNTIPFSSVFLYVTHTTLMVVFRKKTKKAECIFGKYTTLCHSDADLIDAIDSTHYHQLFAQEGGRTILFKVLGAYGITCAFSLFCLYDFSMNALSDH